MEYAEFVAERLAADGDPNKALYGVQAALLDVIKDGGEWRRAVYGGFERDLVCAICGANTHNHGCQRRKACRGVPPVLRRDYGRQQQQAAEWAALTEALNERAER